MSRVQRFGLVFPAGRRSYLLKLYFVVRYWS